MPCRLRDLHNYLVPPGQDVHKFPERKFLFFLTVCFGYFVGPIALSTLCVVARLSWVFFHPRFLPFDCFELFSHCPSCRYGKLQKISYFLNILFPLLAFEYKHSSILLERHVSVFLMLKSSKKKLGTTYSAVRKVGDRFFSPEYSF